MSRFAISLTSIGLLFAVPCTAAPVPAGPKPAEDAVPYAAAKLLQHRKVQKELKMTAEQRINLHDALEDIEDDYLTRIEALDKLPNVPDDAFEKLDSHRSKLVEKQLTATAEKDLTAPQKFRLRQVDRQLRGPAAFAAPDVQKALQLTEAQKKAAAELKERAEVIADRYVNALGNGDEEVKVKEEVAAFRKDETAKFVAGLTADQRDQWKRLLGDPVKGFDLEAFWFRVVEEDDTDTTN